MKSLLFGLQIVSIFHFSVQICENYTFWNSLKCTSLEDLSSSTGFERDLLITPPENSPTKFKELKQFSNSYVLRKIQWLKIEKLINSLSMEAFKNFQNLKDLNLYENKIENIGHGTFRNLKIKFLRLERNRIKSIEKGAFENLTNLTLLNLNDNNLTSIKAGIYTNLPVAELAFSNNQIQEIERLALVNLPKLRILDLNGNRLYTFLAQEILDRPETVQTLLLKDNQLREISASMLEGLISLQHLYLSHNLIRRIEPKSFIETPKLLHLSLSHNQLTLLDSNILPNRGLEELRYIELDHNRLTFLSSKFLVRLPNLFIIEIGGNPWQCACLDAILFWLETRNVIFKCDTTYFYNGKRPVCVVPQDDTQNCQYSYDQRLWDKYRKFYANYSLPEDCY